MDKNNGKEVARTWGETLHIPPAIIEEVKMFDGAGWALASSGQPRQLTAPELKLVALICHRTGLSVAGKQMIFLGNSLYITKGGKVAKARQDEKMPLVRVETRPATDEERQAEGLPAVGEQSDPTKRDYLAYAEIHAKVDDKVEKVSSAFGHANVGNINLRGKERDSFRLCKDMSETRAISRALSQVYDFFGLASYEEVAMGRPVEAEYTVEDNGKTTTENLTDRMKKKADDLPATTPPDGSSAEGAGSDMDVAKIREWIKQHRSQLPSRELEQIEAELEIEPENLTPDGLKEIWDSLQALL